MTAFQFAQERGLVAIDSPVVGLVAIVPIGMMQVSSVNLTVETGATLTEGEAFGYFLFGGSDRVRNTGRNEQPNVSSATPVSDGRRAATFLVVTAGGQKTAAPLLTPPAPKGQIEASQELFAPLA